MSRAKGARVDLDTTRDRLEALGMPHAGQVLEQMLHQAVKEEQALHLFLDRVLKAEQDQREERRVSTSLRLSGLPQDMTLGNFEFAFQPGIEKGQIETLATCAWIRAQETVLFQGPPGIGKTHLAVALGVKAVENGFSVAYYRLDDLLHAMKQNAEVPPRRLKGKKYFKAALLIIDEMGFQALTRQEATLFFRLVSYRYQKGSIIITTNKSVKDWAEVIAGDEVMTAAILDRLLHRCHVFNIKGRSYRLKELEGSLKQ
ncbi:MAG: IS21-like element helper ATPase IstB [bacterium]